MPSLYDSNILNPFMFKIKKKPTLQLIQNVFVMID